MRGMSDRGGRGGTFCGGEGWDGGGNGRWVCWWDMGMGMGMGMDEGVGRVLCMWYGIMREGLWGGVVASYFLSFLFVVRGVWGCNFWCLWNGLFFEG